jgi:hypothetical protein
MSPPEIKPETMSLFEQEMQDQLAAARDAVIEAGGRGDPLLLEATQNHLDSLLGLARRNGIVVDVTSEEPRSAPAV